MIVDSGNGNSGTKWTLDEMLLLSKLKRAGNGYQEIADILTQVHNKRPYTQNCCKKKWNDTNWETVFAEDEERQKLVADFGDKESEKQKVIETTLANQERLVRREQARTEIIIDSIKSSIYRLPPPKKQDITYTPKPPTEYTSEHVGLLLGDFHIGASYTLEDTGGIAEFNLEIFKGRLQRLKDGVLEIVERHRHMYELPELHIFCLGDMVAGMNEAGHWSPDYIDLDVSDQMMEGMAGLRDLLATWSQAFPHVNFYGVFGNHGRIGRKGMQKAYCNWDWLCYKFTRMSLAEYDNITWNIPKSWFLQVKVQNHSFYITHGDGINSSMGIPYYGIEKAERNILGLLDEKPDYFCMGHFHSPAEIQTNSGRIIVNGSMVGGDMYSSRELRRSDKPLQKMFGIHPKKGITWTYNINLSEGC